MNDQLLRMMVSLQNTSGALVDRMDRNERGQTGSEYLGIVIVVAVIIAALSQTTLGTTIRTSLTSAVSNIAGNLPGEG